ncbi:MAG: IclR family transcriptional regulator [Hydrogenophaga sp.]|uniref:IclR family transcriptional regulator n=1 Tax=Hydrogenophaga crocea TaxID=2716225 RepID=A0A6G8IME1_9BURK|nr:MULTISPECIES: IclR family transcriptional regulator [Hydrogenophaga]MBL0946343.1 IclR family transcriptional regulator [Hydrogenophaga sp.]QIM54283.1 IclR family transcriptional regulator [Hydrogenophaga crocea]
MNLALDRGLSLLEHLARHPDGLPLALMAEELDIPLSACHRLLSDLQHRGYVRQKRKQGDYQLTTKVVSIGLGYLSHGGLVDIAGPLLERLAQQSGELVRLSIVDDDRLTFVAKAQGERQQGVRYDPDMGADVWLSCSASGHAWLATLSDERAVALVARQGYGSTRDFGPKAPTTIKALLGFLHAARVRGYAMIDEVFAPGMCAMAAPVLRRQQCIGVISIAGPRSRLGPAAMQALAPSLLAAAAELGPVSNASGLFGRPPLGKG